MGPGVASEDRAAVVRGYRGEVEHYINDGDGLRAFALIFDFVDELCPNFQDRAIALSTSYQHHFLSGQPSADTLQEFQSEAFDLLDDMTEFVLPGAALGLHGTGVQPTSGELVELKKRVLQQAAQGAETLVSVRDAYRTLGSGKGAFTLGPVSMDVARGDIIGLVGHNASGKTTLLRLLAGDLAATKGAATFPGLATPSSAQDRMPTRGWRRIRSRIAFVKPKLDAISGKVIDAMHLTGAAYRLAPAETLERTNAYLHRFGLAEHADKKVQALSTGFRLRFEIARILMTDPDLLILDEPLANLDAIAQQVLLSDLRALASSVQRPRAIVISSQHISEIEAISDRVIVLANGKCLFAGTKDDIPTQLGVGVFEILGDDPRAIANAARALSPLEVIDLGISIVVVYPVSVARERVLEEFTRQNVQVSAFNDLSRSAKSLLYLNKMLAEGRLHPSGRA